MYENRLEIGKLKLNSKVSLAPMAGVTDAAFRQIVRETSPDCLLTTEMLSSEAILWNREQSILHCEDFEHPIAYQLSGHKPDIMAKAAKRILSRADMIDINMGCPVNKIVKNQDGSALMKNPKLAFDIVKAVKDVIDVPLSVKFRLGWDNNSKNYVEFGKLMQEAGADMITLHARTRAQMYCGKADWAAIKELTNEVGIPVFANGDIKSTQDAIECQRLSNCAGVAIGRGIIGDPGLIARIEHYFQTGKILSEPSLNERIDVLIKHFEREIFYRSEEPAVRFMRKFHSHYIKNIKGAAAYRDRLVKIPTFDEVLKVYDEIRQNA